MVDNVLDKEVQAVFVDLLKSPARKLVVLPPEAEKIVAKRVRLLSMFTQPNAPIELKEKYDEATKLTELCHQIGEAFTTLADEVSSESKLSDADLLLSAGVYLKSGRPSTGPYAEELSMLHGSTLAVLVAAARDPARAKQPRSDIIRQDMRGLSDTQMTSVMIEAALLWGQVEQWRLTLEALGTVAELGLICRGMLYRGLVGDLGSQLERRASLEKFKGDLAKVPVEAASAIPVAGHFIAPAKLIVEMMIHLFDKERALEEEVKDEIAKHKRALEFVELYLAAIQVWANWAQALQQQVVAMLMDMARQMAGQPAPVAAAGSAAASPPP
jgi:hypothetical protein